MKTKKSAPSRTNHSRATRKKAAELSPSEQKALHRVVERLAAIDREEAEREARRQKRQDQWTKWHQCQASRKELENAHSRLVAGRLRDRDRHIDALTAAVVALGQAVAEAGFSVAPTLQQLKRNGPWDELHNTAADLVQDVLDGDKPSVRVQVRAIVQSKKLGVWERVLGIFRRAIEECKPLEEADLGNAGGPTPDATELLTITDHGGRSYSVKGFFAVSVSMEVDRALQSLKKRKSATCGQIEDDGCTNASKAMTRLLELHPEFRHAIRTPRPSSRGEGYAATIISPPPL